jgi:probable HAF family extracellular repeat protein
MKSNYYKFIWALLIIATLCIVVSQPATAQRYTITDLGPLGGNSSLAHGINDHGQVVGYAFLTNNSSYHAFLYSNGIMQDLGTLDVENASAVSEAFAINNLGQVVGCSMINTGKYHAFLYSNGQMIDLGTFGGSESFALGINDLGEVVGWAYIAGDSERHAFLYSNGQMIDLGTLGRGFYDIRNSEALAINNSGQIVGMSESHAFLYSNGQMHDLGDLGNGGDSSVALSINSPGQIVGYSYIFGSDPHGFLYSNGVMQDLGTLGGNYSIARGINDLNQIVGDSNNINWSDRCFLYSDGYFVDLGLLFENRNWWTLDHAYDINNSGQIVGEGSMSINPNQGSLTHAFLLTPIPSISVSPSSIDFGNVPVGSSSAPQTFTISNSGTPDLHISGMSLSDTTNYSLNVNGGSSPCASTTPTIAPNSNCTVTVTFSPLSTGKKDVNLTINSDDPDKPTLNVPLSGTGVIPLVECHLVPDATSIHRGGTLGFWASAQNNEGTTQNFKSVTKVKLPNGNMYPSSGWLLGPISVTLGPHTSKSKYLTQFIPYNAPFGTYTYYGYVGTAGPPVVKYNECQFTFTVTTQGQGCTLCHQ